MVFAIHRVCPNQLESISGMADQARSPYPHFVLVSIRLVRPDPFLFRPLPHRASLTSVRKRFAVPIRRRFALWGVEPQGDHARFPLRG